MGRLLIIEMVRATVVFIVLLLGVAVNSQDGLSDISGELLESPEHYGEFGHFNSRVLTRRRRSVDWNVVVDSLLAQARTFIIAEGKDELSIPDIDERFEKRFGFIKATGKFQARNGRVRSVASIRRTGDVTFDSVPNQSVTLTAHLGFGEVFLRYDNYKAKIWKLGPSGRISARVGGNSVRLRLRLNVEENSCSVVIEDATVVDLGGFDVKVTGLGPLNWLTSKIVTWVARKRRGDIMRSLDRAMRRGLEKAIERFNCDNYIKELRGLTS